MQFNPAQVIARALCECLWVMYSDTETEILCTKVHKGSSYFTRAIYYPG